MKPTIGDAYAMGGKGAKASESERLLFEAWMKGHCWSVIGTWNGSTYLSNNEPDPHAMQTRMLWAAWRDRAELAA